MLNASPVAQDLVASFNGGKVSAQSLESAQNAAKTSTIGLTIAQTALNMALSLGLTALISLIIKGYDELSNSVENCKKRVDDLVSSYNSALDIANNNAKRVEELADKYESLSEGVNKLGENVSLTNEEYEQYNSLTNEIAEMFPTLVQGWTDEGNAILNLKGNIEQLRDAYKEAQQEAYNLLIVSGKDSDGNDIIKQWEDTHETGFWSDMLNLGADKVGAGISVADALKQLRAIQQMSADEYREIERIVGSGSRKEISGLTDIEKEIGYGSYLYEALGLDSNSTDEEFRNAQKQAKALVQTYNAEIESALSDVETLANAYLMTNEDYDNLDSQLKTAASLIVNSLNADIANKFSSKEDVGTYVDGIVQSLSSNEDIQKALVNLFSIDSTNMSINETQQQVDKYVGTIATELDENPVELKTRLGFDDSDVKPLVNKVQGYLNDEFDSKVGELTLDELNTASELEIPEGTLLSWDELITKIKEAQDTASGNETTLPSIIDSWNSLIDTDEEELKNTRKDLLALAEAGQLTAETFHDTTGADTFLDGISESLPEAIDWINQLVSSSTQLQSMSAQISKMSDMLADKKNGTTASASDLAGFDVEVRGLDSWKEFESVMMSSESTMEQCQKAANDLATEWVNNGNFLANLTDETKQAYITQLQMMGIENAEAIVKDALVRITQTQAMEEEFLAQKKAETSDATYSLINATADEITKFAEEKGYADNVTNALIELALKKQLVNGTTLDFSGDLVNISNYVKALGGTADAIGLLNRIKKGEVYMPGDAMASVIASAQAEIDSALVSGTKTNVQVTPTGSSTYKGGKTKDTKDSKQTINWIERRVKSLNNHIDLTQSKLENLSNIKSPKDLAKKIDAVTKKLKAASENTDKWKNNLSKIKIPESAKKLIQSGKDVDLSKYSKAEQKNIKKYQSTWKKYTSAKKKENSLYDQKWDLETQRGKEKYLKSQEKDYNTLAKVEEKAYKRYMKKANSIKLSDSLKKKVRSGDYNINDYSSKQQELIQEYQNWYDKAQESLIGKQEAKKNARDKRIERYQLYADNAEAKIAKSQALAALSEGNYKEQNKRLEGQKKYLREQYEAQIKIAEAEENTLEVERLRAELLKELRDKTKEQFDNIDATYSMKIGFTDNKVKAFQDQISLLEAQGQQIGSRLYTKQMELNQLNIDKLNTERRKQIKKVDEFGVGTPEWYEAQDAIFATERALKQYEIEQANLQKSINQLKFDRFDNLLNKLNDIIDETDFLISMLDSDNFYDDNGNMTSDGVTAMGLTAQNYDTYLAQAEKYKQMLSDVKDMYDAGKISLEEYEEYQRKYSQSQREAIKSANDAKKAVVDLVEQGLNAQTKALEEAVSKQKELLQSEKD